MAERSLQATWFLLHIEPLDGLSYGAELSHDSKSRTSKWYEDKPWTWAFEINSDVDSVKFEKAPLQLGARFYFEPPPSMNLAVASYMDEVPARS